MTFPVPVVLIPPFALMVPVVSVMAPDLEEPAVQVALALFSVIAPVEVRVPVPTAKVVVILAVLETFIVTLPALTIEVEAFQVNCVIKVVLIVLVKAFVTVMVVLAAMEVVAAAPIVSALKVVFPVTVFPAPLKVVV